MYLLAYLYMFFNLFVKIQSFCPSQCTCIYHGRSDGTGTRSVLCNDPDMSEIPVNVPVDTVKLRVEKTVVRRIPSEAFYYLVDLKYLWVTYNSISNIDPSSFYNLKVLHELRLDGNLISTFPWESLMEMPNLRSLDLHNNRLAVIPSEAARYLKDITYLDISSNKLTTLPPDLLDIWFPFSRSSTATAEKFYSTVQKVILGLQDNPWFCDCRVSKLIELSKLTDVSIVLLDSLVACNGPENLAGVLFQRAELEQCLKPSVMTSATKITSPLGSNILLRCDATGSPTPNLVWSRSDNLPVNYTVIQETPGEGIRWSVLSLTGISYKDAGEYRCKAKNLAGTSEASITLTVIGTITTTVSPQKFLKKPDGDQVTTTISSLNVPMLTVTTGSGKPVTESNQPRSTSAAKKPAKAVPNANKKVQKGDGDKKEPVASSKAALPAAGQNITIKNLKVISETDQSVTLTWKAFNVTSSSALNVLYSKHGEKEILKMSTEPGKNKASIDGLSPNTKYMACVCPKGAQPRKNQCVVFSTSETSSQVNYQSLIIIIAGSAACVLVLPVVFFLLYKVVKLQCKPKPAREEDLLKETYVKFETLSLRPRSLGTELWARRNSTESERLLLCSRSSIDSHLTFKSDSSRSEYLC
ncbi:leucine-rich repeat, immunoglobulin-like domain and transmembrane domain-containing protein 3b [Latimeria chalumnae]|uniref:leucine-rich repeat, immunoglobulin-like domain and transmembrane domain-containing protein 3b n=1 Tax=Latimeria chalumnae TaxID=7897 RepID=UPI0006D8EA55|nr:PREDICTED: leucine-rich repeat, immunoglobulin-like domain and transmembrane domain-containing protein 3 [Latimeria chalumnae]|eukprot:XP_006012653.2 PREDICTED: leucine-rich repeat, immunoglobulin-like domain and transmembrane domain-containing protein 3 [Latimeria chalumnae]